jgi:ATP/maltotriose-dependent transcriptional regulator MalT
VAAPVERGRAAFGRQAWREAFAAFSAAAAETPLDVTDQERLAISAYLVGEDDSSTQAWEAAHRAALRAGDPPRAARCAFWLALGLLLRGHPAQAGGWLTRVERLIEESGTDCSASGLLLIPAMLTSLGAGDPVTARDLAVRATALGDRFGDPDLRALGTLGHGQALIAMGELRAGVARLDEVMLSVTGDEVGPVTTGIVYCAVILECMQLYDLQRAAEWTGALSSWCDAQPDLAPYRGQCLVHRSQLQQSSGAWSDAISTAEAACDRLARPPHPALGLAYYQVADLHRLVGEVDRAEAEYREASRHGQNPMPGLALLQLARGADDQAVAGIRRALLEARDALQRPALLYAAVDIYLAAGDLLAARSAANELTSIAAGSSSHVLGAMAEHALGAVLVAEGDPVTALAELRSAGTSWQGLNIPYEAARTAVWRGTACGDLGDAATALVELGNARDTFAQLGATADLERVTAQLNRVTGKAPMTATRDVALLLSDRERQVLAEVATGKTNREVAQTLAISQHTVGRHLENIFTKLGVTTRAAAIAAAYERRLLGAPGPRTR